MPVNNSNGKQPAFGDPELVSPLTPTSGSFSAVQWDSPFSPDVLVSRPEQPPPRKLSFDEKRDPYGNFYDHDAQVVNRDLANSPGVITLQSRAQRLRGTAPSLEQPYDARTYAQADAWAPEFGHQDNAQTRVTSPHQVGADTLDPEDAKKFALANGWEPPLDHCNTQTKVTSSHASADGMNLEQSNDARRFAQADAWAPEFGHQDNSQTKAVTSPHAGADALNLEQSYHARRFAQADAWAPEFRGGRSSGEQLAPQTSDIARESRDRSRAPGDSRPDAAEGRGLRQRLRGLRDMIGRG